jgi:hypothetical protein
MLEFGVARLFSIKPFLMQISYSLILRRGGVELLKSKPRIYSFVNIALGSQPGVLKINEMGNKTSFMMRTPLTAASIEKSYNVEVSTLDAQLQILDCSLGVCGRTTAGSTFSPGKS